MKSSLFLSLFSLMIVSSAAVADSVGTVNKVVCHAAEVSPVCHVALNGSPVMATCVSSGWHYTFDGSTSEGKNILSILLAAQVSKQAITIGGKGTCLLTGGSEDLRHAYITTP